MTCKRWGCLIPDISDNTESEQALLDSVKYFRAMTDVAPVMMWQADIKGAATWFSKTWLNFTGRRLEECLGDRWLAAVHPDDLELIVKRFEDALANGTSFSAEYRLLHRDGNYRWILGNGSPTHDAEGLPFGYASSCVDITSRREAEMEFRLTQHVMDEAADAIFWVRSDASLHYANDEACRSLGYTREQLLNLTIMDFTQTAGALSDGWESHWRTLKKLKYHTIESRHRRKDGSTFPVEVNVNYVQFNRQEFHCAFVRDITERKISQAAVTRKTLEATLIHRVTTMAAETNCFGEALQKCIDFVCDAVRWPIGHVYVPANSGAARLVPTGIWHIDEAMQFESFVAATRDTDLYREIGLPGRIWAAEAPIYINNVQTDDNFLRAESCRKDDLRGAFGFPVKVSGRVVAVLEFYANSETEIEESMLQVMRTVGEQIGRVIERTRANERVSRREKEFADLFDNASVGVHLIGPDGIIQQANTCELNLLGYTREEYEQHHISDFHVDQDVIQEILRRLEAGETLQQYPARLRCKDGSIRHVEINSNVYWENGHFEHTRCFTTDVTESREREAALSASEKKLSAISDAAIDAVVMADAENRVVHWNPAAERMFGYSMGEISRQRIQDMLTPERYRESADAGGLTFSNSGNGPITGEIRELTGLRKDGSEFPMELSVSGIQMNGRWWTVAIARDITDRKSAEQRLTKALREAQAANNAKSEFLTVVSHEMRTPLNSVLGTLDLTLQTKLDKDQQQMLDLCLRSGTQLKALIDDVLDYSQFKAGRFSLQPQVMDLYEILGRIRETFGPRSQDKGLEFRWQVDPEIPTLLWGDGGRLCQVIDNLLNNAIKFTNAGYIAFRAELEKSNQGGAVLSFTVEDSGIGIPPEHRARIFHRFEQVDSGSTRVFGGVGLGLSVCDELVKLMGSEIRCEGVAGGGSRFVFNAECAKPTKQQIEYFRRRSSEYSEPDISFHEVHVLLAEDDPASRVVAKRMLENAGVVVTTVTDGRQVVEEFRRNPNRFSAIFMDIMMPFLDGIEATRQIRELQHTQIPVIAMTAKTLVGDRERILNSKLDAYLSKPIERTELLRTLRRVIGKGADQIPADQIPADQIPADQEPSAEQRTAILDSVAFCRRCDNDMELLSEISELFGNTCDDTLKQIEESLDRKDQSGVVSAAHLLKGSVTNMCARQALQVSEQVELSARRSDLDGVNNLMTTLKSEILKLRLALKAVLDVRR